MGGDYAPEAIMLGSALAFKELPENTRLVLIGDENQITSICRNHSIPVENFEIVHATQQIGMGDHPIKAFSQKSDSSIVVGFRLLKEGKIDSFASAGNTGAMLVGAMQVIKSVPGIIRPAIAAALPRLSEKPVLLLDVGLNPDCRPDVLYQYAILGKIYARDIFGISEPRIGLLNIGSEDEKGNLLTKSTFQAMKDTTDFIADVKAATCSDRVDVIVAMVYRKCNAERAEAFYSLIRTRRGDPFFEKFNFIHIGGPGWYNAPHFCSWRLMNCNQKLIRQSIDVVKAELSGKIKEAFK
jgi:glycerol-3-phosphate acyltransferase PlsX